MNSSNLIPMLALAGAGSVMVIFWGASKFTGSSTDSQPEVAVNVSEKTEAATARTPARAESFSWDDEPEKQLKRLVRPKRLSQPRLSQRLSIQTLTM